MRSLLLIFALVIARLSSAQSPMPDPVLGSRPGAFSARNLSLGHCILTAGDGPSALMGNPATLTNQKSLLGGELSGDVSRIKETRKYPFYDAFDGVLGYNNYAMNDHLYSKLDGGLAFRLPMSSDLSVVLSAASYSAYRFDYRYHEEVRERYSSGGIQDLKKGENKLDLTGDLRSVAAGGAVGLKNILSVGFSASALMGKWDYLKGVYFTDTTRENYVDRIDYEPKDLPLELNGGATVQLGERVTLGARALLPAGDYKFKRKVKPGSNYSLNVDQDTLVSKTLTETYPGHFALGLQYRPQNEFRPVLLLEGEIQTYHDVADSLDNTFEVRAGVEQTVVPGSPVRLGFVYASSPSDKDRATSLFTAGIGFTLQKLTGDFAIEIGKINYLHPDLFPQHLYSVRDRVDNDRVETALFRGLVTLKYAL